MLFPSSPDNITVDNISHVFDTGIQVSVLRLDQLHPVISGNKWFKLHYYLEEAKSQQKNNIVTFGGAWSNHIIATAAACRLYGLASTGIIRGEKPSSWSATLLQAKEYGMQLVFIPRAEYTEKEIPVELLTPDSYVIPEGGYGEPGARGAARILDFAPSGFTHCCCAVGTGTMIAGLINRCGNDQQVTGISVLKNNNSLQGEIASLTNTAMDTGNWSLLHDYHFGGYAKYEPSLLAFMNRYYEQTGIPSDFVYTGKLFFGVADLIRINYFPPESHVVVIHSGGLQGNISLPKGTLIF